MPNSAPPVPHGDTKSAFPGAHVARTRFFTFRIQKRTPGNQIRVVINKKIGGAAVRNRLRRQIREYIRQRFVLPRQNTFVVIVIPQPAGKEILRAKNIYYELDGICGPRFPKRNIPPQKLA